jgi:hypothetical protein
VAGRIAREVADHMMRTERVVERMERAGHTVRAVERMDWIDIVVDKLSMVGNNSLIYKITNIFLFTIFNFGRHHSRA